MPNKPELPMNTRRDLVTVIASLGVALASPRAAFAQAGTPLRLVVPYPPGGSSDRAARLLAEALQPRIGGTVIVENIAGAGGRLAMRQLLVQGGDTNVLVLANPAIMVVAPFVYKNNGYDPDRDYQPVSQITRYEFGVAVGAEMPARTVGELVAWMKANPAKANLGVPASGSLPHFFALMLGQAAQTPTTVVPFKGSAPMITDLLGGHVPVAIDALDALLPHHEAGKVRILATSGDKRSAGNLPTFKESGMDVIAVGWNVLYAKAAMPAESAERLAREIAQAMASPALQKAFLDAKAEPVSASRGQTRAMLDEFKARWVPVIQKSGLQFE
jgi:tripartite-type tricarboxylate transporter receptor subunit TctC